jgi:hypothetical protein
MSEVKTSEVNTEELLARAGMKIAGIVESDEKSNDASAPDPEFKDTVPVGDLSTEMVGELVAAFCRDTRSLQPGVSLPVPIGRSDVNFIAGVSLFHLELKNFVMRF